MAEVTVTLVLSVDEARALKRLLDRPSQEEFEADDNLLCILTALA